MLMCFFKASKNWWSSLFVNKRWLGNHDFSSWQRDGICFFWVLLNFGHDSFAVSSASHRFLQASFSYIRKADPKDPVKFQKTVQKVLQRQDNMVELMTLVSWQVCFLDGEIIFMHCVMDGADLLLDWLQIVYVHLLYASFIQATPG